jgi:hypothetical protein
VKFCVSGTWALEIGLKKCASLDAYTHSVEQQFLRVARIWKSCLNEKSPYG